MLFPLRNIRDKSVRKSEFWVSDVAIDGKYVIK